MPPLAFPTAHLAIPIATYVPSQVLTRLKETLDADNKYLASDNSRLQQMLNETMQQRNAALRQLQEQVEQQQQRAEAAAEAAAATSSSGSVSGSTGDLTGRSQEPPSRRRSGWGKLVNGLVAKRRVGKVRSGDALAVARKGRRAVSRGKEGHMP